METFFSYFFLRVKEDTRTFVSHYYSKNIVGENSCLFINRFIAEQFWMQLTFVESSREKLQAVLPQISYSEGKSS